MHITHECYECKSTDIKWSTDADLRLGVFIKMKCQKCGIIDTKYISKLGAKNEYSYHE